MTVHRFLGFFARDGTADLNPGFVDTVSAHMACDPTIEGWTMKDAS
jgi:hypothetical protein